jgi:N-acetylglucosamine kinase-like BadF-type ATPase
LLVGVDGGGSKTHCIVVDVDGELLGFGDAAASNWEGVGLEGARSALAEALAEATHQAGVSLAELAGAVFGLGGVDWPSDVDRLQPVIESLGVKGPHRILNDTFIALRAGTDDGVGVVIVAGSGTTVAACNHSGEMYRTLGQGGPLFDDFGSAPDVAERAVQAVARWFTGRGPSTVLVERLCEVTGAADVAHLLEGLSRGTLAVPAAAPIVLKEAEAGDGVARKIVRNVGSALGESAAVAIRRLHLEDEAFDVVLAGGLFRGLIDLLWDSILEPVTAAAPGAKLVRLEAPPVVGAGLLALELVGAEAGPEIRSGLSAASSRAAAP